MANPPEKEVMPVGVKDALALMIAFATLIISVIGVVIALINMTNTKK